MREFGSTYLRLWLGVDDADDFDLDVAVPPEPVLLDLYLGRVWNVNDGTNNNCFIISLRIRLEKSRTQSMLYKGYLFIWDSLYGS